MRVPCSELQSRRKEFSVGTSLAKIRHPRKFPDNDQVIKHFFFVTDAGKKLERLSHNDFSG
jgi:hypothetical protein